MEKNRLEAFSDGVFAIVITLLILNIKLPDVDYAHLGNALSDLLPSVGIYAISFILIGLYWVFHHTSMIYLKKVNGLILWLNIFLLLFVSFLPFPAMLMAKYPLTPIPIVVYGTNLLLANGVGYLLLWVLGRNEDLRTEKLTEAVLQVRKRVYIVVNFLYICAIGLGFVHPALSIAIFVGIVFVLIQRHMKEMN
jgi:uncharacterized membrane protein